MDAATAPAIMSRGREWLTPHPPPCPAPCYRGRRTVSSVRKRGRVWYYRFVDADGGQHERKGGPDRRETEAMAASEEAQAAKVRAVLIDPKALGFRANEARPLAYHLAD